MDVSRFSVPAALAASTTRPLPVLQSQVYGTPDIAVRTPTGIVVRCRQIGAARVTAAELEQALQGIALLPASDQALIARSGVPVDLVPSPVLEQNMVGATQIDESPGHWVPTRVRIATRSPLALTNPKLAIREVTQHELGHVLAVLTGQDRSEAAADAYAASH